MSQRMALDARRKHPMLGIEENDLLILREIEFMLVQIWLAFAVDQNLEPD